MEKVEESYLLFRKKRAEKDKNPTVRDQLMYRSAVKLIYSA